MSNRCRHFNGIQHDCCELRVEYRSIRDESVRPFLYPCLSDKASTNCPGLSRLTQGELDREEKEGLDSMAKVMTARRVIVGKVGKQRSVSGSIECPACKAELRYAVASNGHIHAACSTPDCVRWME